MVIVIITATKIVNACKVTITMFQIFSFNLDNHKNTVIVSSLWEMKRRHRQLKALIQDHTIGKGEVMV